MTLPLRACARLMLCCALLVGCGNSDNAEQARDALADVNTWVGHARPDTDPASMRQTLVQVGRPILSVSIAKTRYAGMMTPYGQNRNVQTWASAAPETVSLRDGILIATRGFGPDMMTSVAPDVGQVRSGGGAFHRTYYYLDGADQPQSLTFDCEFAANGPEAVAIIGLSYPTRRVTEDCASPTLHIQNIYWFDGSGKLRQSDQFVSPQLGTMRLQRVID